MKKEYPNEEEIERTKKLIELFDIENGEELNKLY